jgi:cell division septum initiation protein DivIVA
VEVKELEGRITKLKADLAKKGAAATDPKAKLLDARETRKELKRAQRQKRVLTTKTAYIEAKGKKKVKAGEGAKTAP